MTKQRKHRQMPQRFNPLATYNGELARGLVHTEVWEEKMAALQEDFYEWQVESHRACGDEVVTDDAGRVQYIVERDPLDGVVWWRRVLHYLGWRP